MAVVTEPIILDETGQDIVTQLQAIVAGLAPNAGQISYSNATSGLSADDVQEAIDEVESNVVTVSNSLTNYIKVVEKNIGNITMSANASGYLSVSVNNETGYTPIGIVGYTANGTASSAIQEFRVSNGKAYIYLMNLTSASKTVSNITLSILYIKNMS